MTDIDEHAEFLHELHSVTPRRLQPALCLRDRLKQTGPGRLDIPVRISQLVLKVPCQSRHSDTVVIKPADLFGIPFIYSTLFDRPDRGQESAAEILSDIICRIRRPDQISVRGKFCVQRFRKCFRIFKRILPFFLYRRHICKQGKALPHIPSLLHSLQIQMQGVVPQAGFYVSPTTFIDCGNSVTMHINDRDHWCSLLSALVSSIPASMRGAQCK